MENVRSAPCTLWRSSTALALGALLTIIVGCITEPRSARVPAVPVSPGSGEDLRGTGAITGRTWVLGTRVIPFDDENTDDRSQWQTFAHLRLEPNLIVGVDFTPLDPDVGVIVAYRWVEETEVIPSVTFASGSDRIGTEEGSRSYSLTAGKQFLERIDLYGSLAYGQDGDRMLFPFGVAFRPWEQLSIHARYDGVHLHPGVLFYLEKFTLGALWVEQEEFGITMTVGFGF